MTTWRAIAFSWLALLLQLPIFPVYGDFQGSTHLMPFDEDTIAYSKAKDTGPIAQLQRRIDGGKASLKFDRKSDIWPLCSMTSEC